MSRSFLLKHTLALGAAVLLMLTVLAGVVFAATGDLLATVTLPSNSTCNVGIAFDGTYVMTIDDGACFGQEIGIYTPPAGNGAATLVATKTVKDGLGNLVNISVIDWDSGRGKLWGAYGNAVYLIDIGNPAVSGDALATFMFNPGVGGSSLVDGLAWDSNDDTLYYSPDVNLNVYQFSLGPVPPLGTLVNTVAPKNALGVADGKVSGVAIGAGNTLYIGRDGDSEIRRVDKTTGAFVSAFATTADRVEDLVCDPVTYAPLEAILAKDAYNSLYEAFEVEAGTCPLPIEIALDPPAAKNEAGSSHTVTATVTAGAPVVAQLVSFKVTAGPNVGQSSDPGECSVNANCTTDGNGQVSWTYTSNNVVGTDVIVACTTDDDGVVHCARVVKYWVDTRPPKCDCVETVNPHGKNVPPAGKTTLPGPKGGQNEDGFYELLARDSVDPNPSVYVVDTGKDGIIGTADDTTFGPYASGTRIKYTEANGATPTQKKIGSATGQAGAVDWHITGNGDAAVFAVDASGNDSAKVACLVPPPPK